MRISAIQNTILIVYGLILSPLIVNVYMNHIVKTEDHFISVKTEIERIPYSPEAIDSLFVEEYRFSCGFKEFLDSLEVCPNDTVYVANLVVGHDRKSLKKVKAVYSKMADKVIADECLNATSEALSLDEFENYEFKYLDGSWQFIQRILIKDGFIREVSYLDAG